jgi:sterol 3beta-glucosyltransferase
VRIGIQTWGSEGDVRPLLALATGLRGLGHQVELVYTSVEGRDWRATASTLGVSAEDLGRDELARQRSAREGDLESLLALRNPLQQVRVITDLFLEPIVEEMFERAVRLCEVSDVVIAHFLCHPLIAAARQAGKPLVLLFTGPALPSADYPPLGAPPLGPLNRLAWRLLGQLAGPALLRSANNLRRRHGIAELSQLFGDALDEPALMLTAVSPALFPQPKDWHGHHHVSGYLTMPDAGAGEALSSDVDEFLDAGASPIFMTFGSMLSVASGEARDGARLMVEAAERAGCRAIVQAPWAQLGFRSTSDRILHVTRVKHDQVFPRCAAVVHHGGAGTTHSATAAGCPSVLVPYVADQTFWADRLRRLQIAPPARRRRQTTSMSLAADLERVLNDDDMRRRAGLIGARMRSEDGVAEAARLISALAQRFGLGERSWKGR